MKPSPGGYENRTFLGPTPDIPSLRVYDDGTSLCSEWELNAEERAAVAATGKVRLWVFGRSHPPVALGAVGPTGDTIPEKTA